MDQLDTLIRELREFLGEGTMNNTEDPHAPIRAGCTEAESHCWHVAAIQHMVTNHRDYYCCNCGKEQCVALTRYTIPEHGRHYRGELE